MSVPTTSLLVLALVSSFGCKNNKATTTSSALAEVPRDNTAVAQQVVNPIKGVEAKPQTHIATALPSTSRPEVVDEAEEQPEPEPAEQPVDEIPADLDSPQPEEEQDTDLDGADEQPQAAEDDLLEVDEQPEEADVLDEDLALDDSDNGAERDGELEEELDDE